MNSAFASLRGLALHRPGFHSQPGPSAMLKSSSRVRFIGQICVWVEQDHGKTQGARFLSHPYPLPLKQVFGRLAMARTNQTGSWEDKRGCFYLDFSCLPPPLPSPLSAVSAPTGRTSPVDHSESSFSSHFSSFPPFLTTPSPPNPFSTPQLRGIP